MRHAATLLVVQVALLALWLGGAVLFAAVVAPALFAALPTRTLAGAVVGRVLPYVFYSGIAVGAAVMALERRAHDGWRWRGGETAGAVMIASCAVAQLVIAPRIERLRADIGGLLETLAPDDARRAAFGRLHAASVAWLGLAMLSAGVAVVMAARELRRGDR